MNKRDFFNKLVWEGGPHALYEYGIKPENIEDKELRELWQSFCDAMDKATPFADELQRRSNNFWEEESGDGEQHE